MKLNNVRAVITGGVSGLGFAAARHLVANGGKVVLFDVNDEKAKAAIDELGEANARYFNTDVTNEALVQDNMQKAHEFLGEINACVNCAGIIGAGRVLGKTGPMNLSLFQTTVMVNLVGSFNVAKAAANLMQSNPAGDDGERGVIINTASVAAYEGQIGQAAYSASKAGIVGMTLPMARELSRFGIRIVTIAPGVFWTPMVDGMTDEIQASLSASIPFPARLGKPEEYADLAAYILTNPYINGETIRIDGATRLAPK